MKCPFCHHAEDKVIDSRPNEDGNVIKRRRECLACQKRFSTYERIEEAPLFVVKKDGTREAFDRSKILRGIVRSCEKRPVSSDQMNKMALAIEVAARNSLHSEIEAREIGELVMNELKKVDEVSYVRFASVYRQFKDVKSFMSELEKLLDK